MDPEVSDGRVSPLPPMPFVLHTADGVSLVVLRRKAHSQFVSPIHMRYRCSPYHNYYTFFYLIDLCRGFKAHLSLNIPSHCRRVR
jgi:hypothetical protein